jgi:GNAT superfamily N-acetyltransferase
MSPGLSIRRFAPHEWRCYRELRLRALAESPDAFGSTLQLEAARPDAEWDRRLQAGASAPADLPLVAQVDDEPIGLAWGRLAVGGPDTAHLYQVWVAPEHRGRGAGQRLLEAVVGWARQSGARQLELEVVCGDSPARRLYARAGFVPSGDEGPLRPDSPLRKLPMRLAL